jgi:acyl-coenzyme A thioesterase PaaI-like protein
MGLAEVSVRDARDRLAAHGTSRCSVFPPIDESVQLVPPDEPAAAGAEPGGPDPYLRGTPVTDGGHRHEARDGLELLRAQLRGELPRPPIDQLTGIRLVGAEPGRLVFALLASPWLRTTSFTALDVKVNFLQAVPADGRELLATGTVLHRGKRLAISTAEVMHGDVRVAVLTWTTALTPSASPT